MFENSAIPCTLKYPATSRFDKKLFPYTVKVFDKTVSDFTDRGTEVSVELKITGVLNTTFDWPNTTPPVPLEKLKFEVFIEIDVLDPRLKFTFELLILNAALLEPPKLREKFELFNAKFGPLDNDSVKLDLEISNTVFEPT